MPNDPGSQGGCPAWRYTPAHTKQGGIPMMNIPVTKLGIVAVSRDCFPSSLSRARLGKVAHSCASRGLSVFAAVTIVENETDVLKALKELKDAEVNALVAVSYTHLTLPTIYSV